MKFVPNRKLNEANPKFELCHQLRLLKMDFALEYKVSKRELFGERGCVFDIVIIKDNNIVGIVECKSGWKKRKTDINQIRRYEQFGIPVCLMVGEEDIPQAIQFAQKCLTDFKSKKEETKSIVDVLQEIPIDEDDNSAEYEELDFDDEDDDEDEDDECPKYEKKSIISFYKKRGFAQGFGKELLDRREGEMIKLEEPKEEGRVMYRYEAAYGTMLITLFRANDRCKEEYYKTYWLSNSGAGEHTGFVVSLDKKERRPCPEFQEAWDTYMAKVGKRIVEKVEANMRKALVCGLTIAKYKRPSNKLKNIKYTRAS